MDKAVGGQDRKAGREEGNWRQRECKSKAHELFMDQQRSLESILIRYPSYTTYSNVLSVARQAP